MVGSVLELRGKLCGGISDLRSVDHVILYFQLRLPYTGIMN
jgi:hypothetical protein